MFDHFQQASRAIGQLDSLPSSVMVAGDCALTSGEVEDDATLDKPALLVLHHNPDHRPKPSGLIDTRGLLELAAKQTHVKAVFFGHSHRWNIARHEGVHLVNPPAVAYVFSKGMPSAWVDVQLADDGAKLTLNSVKPEHPQDGETVDLKWRAQRNRTVKRVRSTAQKQR
jgi:predicted phosphodiesterase